MPLCNYYNALIGNKNGSTDVLNYDFNYITALPVSQDDMQGFPMHTNSTADKTDTVSVYSSTSVTYAIQVVLLIIALLLSCAPPPVSDPFVFRNDGIQIDLKADHMLNTYNNKAHTVKLAIYLLTDNAAFQERSKSQEGIRDLLQVHKFDPSVASYEKAIVKPNDSHLLIMDRAAGAKWIGIVAGYYSPQGDLPPTKLLEIPFKTKRKRIIRRFGEFTGLLTPYENRYVPALLVQLVLTPETMYETSIFR